MRTSRRTGSRASALLISQRCPSSFSWPCDPRGRTSRALRIAPRRRIQVVTARAWKPARGGGLHAQRLIKGADIVVLVAELVEQSWSISFSCKRRRRAISSARWKAFDLALGLGMSNAAKQTGDALLHQPHLQLGPTAGRLRVPPGRAVIHQHRPRARHG